MNLFEIFYLIICGIGTLNSLLLVFYIFFNKKGNILLNRLFALILLTFTIRISKNLWVFFISDVHPFFHFIWYTSFFAMAFLFSAYVLKITRTQISLSYTWILQIVFALGILGISFLLGLQNLEMNILLSILAALFCAVGLSIKNILQKNKLSASPSTIQYKWLLSNSIFLLFISILYISIFVIPHNVLVTEAFLFSVAVYLLIFFEFKHRIIFNSHKIEVESTESDVNLLNRLNKKIITEHVYLSATLSLPELAKQLSVSPHMLSKVLNREFGLNYNDYINKYRIEEAKKQFSVPKNRNKKISAIAFECGFNSLSVFNSAFKKFTSTTPSEYLKNLPVK